ncbi:Extracellular metalloproteinase mep [Grifola frondosa]|uniref:Extracellular metalloproteinase n=1 Tax=Grifola frondosa TaxID=5627 RepID=A0A1C7LPE0_GRIFR|nr:Extracellular metalloproteinase mep [Grifola frondosa]
MLSFNKLFASVFLSLLYISSVNAIPFSAESRHSTHGSRIIGRGTKKDHYHPKSSYETFGDGIDHPLSKRADASMEDSAVAFMQAHAGISADFVHMHASFSGQTASHVYVKQRVNGIPIANAVANVAFNNKNKVVAYGSSFIDASKVPSAMPSVDVKDAISVAESALLGKHDKRKHPAPSLEYYAKDDGSVALTYVLQVRNRRMGTWYEAFVGAHSGELVSITDFVSDASYRALPIMEETLLDGFDILTDPQDLNSSPEGWHNDGQTSTITTAGNNVIAYKGTSDTTGRTTSQSSPGLNFQYTQNPDITPAAPSNVNAARVNVFYVVNTIHDITYKYGFTEDAFNFQNNNFGIGGLGNDRVTASVQDSSCVNNAFFQTPPDGQNGHMTMCLFTVTSPSRDGALENDIVSHEMTHGVTNRMTGGGTGRCLQTTESGGLGEGWSDAMANWLEQTDGTVRDFVLGQYIVNSAAGIRSHPYSTSAQVNPLRYSSVAHLQEPHAIGEVWANMLHVVYAALVGQLGYSPTARTDPTGSEGNVVFLHLFLDALPLQHCNPTFTTARDAWIQADANRYGGANRCTLWRAFASRGLGVNAKGFVDDVTIPSDC